MQQQQTACTSEALHRGLLEFGGVVHGQQGPKRLWLGFTVNPTKLETGSRLNSAGIPYTLLLRIEATGFPTFRLLL